MIEPLHVVQAAIMKHGIMFTMPRPFRHGHIIRGMCTVLPPPNSGDEQGFMLSDGTFADRGYAMVVAWRAAQVRFPPAPNARLYTEDLW